MSDNFTWETRDTQTKINGRSYQEMFTTNSLYVNTDVGAELLVPTNEYWNSLNKIQQMQLSKLESIALAFDDQVKEGFMVPDPLITAQSLNNVFAKYKSTDRDWETLLLLDHQRLMQYFLIY